MIPVLIVPILNRPELLLKLLASVDVEVDQLVIIDNGGVVPHNFPARVIKTGHNIGVGAAWNLGFKVTPKADWWLVAGSDIEFGPGDLAKAEAQIHPERLFYLLGYSAFIMTPGVLRKIGYFDENFHPAYDEDLDYDRRARIGGIDIIKCEFTGTHVGSATIKSDERYWALNGATHHANDRYYEAKWGGHKEGGERFSSPFGRDGSMADWTLDPDRLRNQSW